MLYFAFAINTSAMSIVEAMAYSEQATMKCVGFSIETHLNYCLKPHLQKMLSYGCMRIGIGVQSIFESVPQEMNRRNPVAVVCHSFHLAKDCGFKVVSHLMRFDGKAEILKSRLLQRWHEIVSHAHHSRDRLVRIVKNGMVSKLYL